jgi:hypothetical protein
MELTNDLLPPLPNIQDIGSEEVKDIYSEEVVELHLDKVAIQNILMKHLKIPYWESSTEEKITVVCNFNHKTLMSAKSIVQMKVRCSECRSKITELSEIIYNSGLDKKIFAIVRINKLGKVVLRCLSREHEMRITYDIQNSKDLPTYCPECIIDSSPSSKSDEMDLAKHLQSINLARGLGNDSGSYMEEYFKYDSCLHHGGDKYEKNIDFDMTDMADMIIDAESDTEQHHPGGCCSDNDYENYFDKIPFGDELKSVEDEVAKELEDSQISHIIATVISRNYAIYIEQKEKAHEKLEKL